MRVSFVIVNYNRKEELLFTLEKTENLIKNNSADYEIIVVDNASTDGSSDAVKINFPNVIIMDNPVNTGAPAWNIGFARAKGEYFIILDDDSHIESGLEEGLLYMDKNPKVGILALNIFGGPYTKENWKWKDGDETVGFIGCGAIFRKKTYEQVGGYADWMFLYVNEWELGLRCLIAGYSVKFFEKSKVIHRAHVSHRSNKRLHVFVTKHEMAIVYKYFSHKRWKFLFRVTINNLKIIKNGEIKNFWYKIIGIYHFFKMRKTLKYTPTSIEVQKLFAETFDTTKKPILGFLVDKFKKK